MTRKIAWDKPPEVIGCWDNGGKTTDRYTVAFKLPGEPTTGHGVPMLGMSGDPTGPLGFSQWTSGVCGPHLGRKLAWDKLPEHIQKHVRARLERE